PTADQLNDPVFRGMMKARAKAAKAAKSAGGPDGGVEVGGWGGDPSAEGGQAGARAVRSGVVGDLRARFSAGNGAAFDAKGSGICRGWMSSRRDWALDDVSVAPKGGRPSSSSRRLPRSRSALAAPSLAPPLPPPQQHQQHQALICGPARPGRASLAKPLVLPAGTEVAVGSAASPGAGRGAKTGGARVCGSGGAKMDDVDIPQKQQTLGVGPRSAVKKKLRGGSAVVGEEASSPAAEVTVAAVGADVQSSSSPSLKQPQTNVTARFRPQNKDGSEARGEQAAPGSRQKRTRDTSAAASTALPSPQAKRQQRQHRGGARGRDMVRQASAQAGIDGQGAAAAAVVATPPAASQCTADTKGVTFSGLCFVLVGLSENTARQLEDMVIGGGGRVLEDIPLLTSSDSSTWLAACGPAPSAGAAAGKSPGASSRAAAAATTTATATASARRRKKARGAEDAVEVVVVVSVPAASRRVGYLLAIATGTPLVHHLWVNDSAAEGRALHAAPYLLPGVRETSRRRQVTSGRGISAAVSTAAAAAAAAAAATARDTLTKVVTRPGTPLTGMTIGVAHPSPATCERWARVLVAAGAHAVRQISGDLLREGNVEEGGKEEDAGTGKVAGTNTAGSGTRSRSARKANTAGDDGGGGGVPFLQKALVGTDCVLCDYPGAWATGDSTDCPPRQGENVPPGDASGAGTTAAGSGSAWPPMMASLGRVVNAARREGVPVVSLSWAIDCVVRGTRVRQQSRPEYLSPFLEESLGAGGRPRGATAAASAAAATSPSRLLVFTSRAGDRYEVDDFVHFSTEAGTSAARRVSSKDSGGSSSSRSDYGVGRIVSLEQAGNGRIFATIEPLQ
ncbi:unnamed protein product, partial [Laminaria digitata]